MVALLCRETARQGGYTSLASSWAIYNEMAESHPEDLEALMRPDWPIQTYGQDSIIIKITHLVDPPSLLSRAHPYFYSMETLGRGGRGGKTKLGTELLC